MVGLPPHTSVIFPFSPVVKNGWEILHVLVSPCAVSGRFPMTQICMSGTYHCVTSCGRGCKNGCLCLFFTPLILKWYVPDSADVQTREHIILCLLRQRVREADCPDGDHRKGDFSFIIPPTHKEAFKPCSAGTRVKKNPGVMLWVIKTFVIVLCSLLPRCMN